MKLAAHPGLYDPDQDPPILRGTRCGQCSATFFPPFSVGCEVCGAPEASLEPADLAATGLIHSVATVHRHGGHDIETPFTVAEIELDDGPLIRATMVENVEPAVIGTRAAARFVVVRLDEEGHEVVEPRFTLVGQ